MGATQAWRRLGTVLQTCAAMILAPIALIAYCICILTPPAVFLSWPLLAWSWYYDTDSIFTPAGWITEHVWLGVLAACLVLFTLSRVEDARRERDGTLVVLGAELVLAWVVLAWAIGSDYTGYALASAWWAAQHIFVGCVGAYLVLAAVRGARRERILWPGVALFLAWPALAWTIGSAFTGYALTGAGWTAERIWLGAAAACAIVGVVVWAVLAVIALVRQ